MFTCERFGEFRTFYSFDEARRFVLREGDCGRLWSYTGAALAIYEAPAVDRRVALDRAAHHQRMAADCAKRASDTLAWAAAWRHSRECSAADYDHELARAAEWQAKAARHAAVATANLTTATASH